jgi:hypothetical protein
MPRSPSLEVLRDYLGFTASRVTIRVPFRLAGMSLGPVQQAHRTSSGPEGSSDKVFPCVTQFGLGSSERAARAAGWCARLLTELAFGNAAT